MQVLVTGGCGYVGSVTVHKLIKQGYDVCVVDDLSSGHRVAIPKTAKLHVGNIGDWDFLSDVFKTNTITHVIHCAAFIDVKESVSDPLKYLDNNVVKGSNLLRVMRENNCQNIVFSSTCAVYGVPECLPLTENSLQKPISVYGSSKLIFEKMLEGYNFNATIFRYFNVAGAYVDGDLMVGEGHEPETHLIPLTIMAALNKESINVYGTNYDTDDGTCVRDYIHVEDLADAHILGLTNNGLFNLGSGKGYSVKEILSLVGKVSGMQLMINKCERRAGDPDKLYANYVKAEKELGWKPKHDIESIILSAYRWHRN